MRKFWVVLAALLASGTALAADAVKKDQSILDRLYASTGVYHRPGTAHTPWFGVPQRMACETLPAPLPFCR